MVDLYRLSETGDDGPPAQPRLPGPERVALTPVPRAQGGASGVATAASRTTSPTIGKRSNGQWPERLRIGRR